MNTRELSTLIVDKVVEYLQECDNNYDRATMLRLIEECLYEIPDNPAAWTGAEYNDYRQQT